MKGNALLADEVADIFFGVIENGIPAERMDQQARDAVSFICFKRPMDISIFRLYNLLTNLEPRTELYINGRQYPYN